MQRLYWSLSPSRNCVNNNDARLLSESNLEFKYMGSKANLLKQIGPLIKVEFKKRWKKRFANFKTSVGKRKRKSLKQYPRDLNIFPVLLFFPGKFYFHCFKLFSCFWIRSKHFHLLSVIVYYGIDFFKVTFSPGSRVDHFAR